MLQRIGMRSQVKRLASGMLDLLYPHRCAGCRKVWLLFHQGGWCRGCLEQLPWIRSPLCPKCGVPFPDSPSSGDHSCGDCLEKPYFFDWARSAAIYAGDLRDRIHQLKFGGKLHWVPPLVDLLVQSLQEHGPPDVQCILPVPLHARRLRQRGFNQAGLIARSLGSRLALPVRFGILVRQRWTEPQTRLGRSERLQNVKNAFAVAKPDVVKDRSVLVLDDVFTTGTTLNECARVLKKAGAHRVYALTIARALPDWPDSDENRMDGAK